ncbi:MAG: helix-turn-helix transcriptional regulator [Rhizobacter sp.]|nr:helix-turn-helix transcriptional regulator [Rhizobacter sp.]
MSRTPASQPHTEPRRRALRAPTDATRFTPTPQRPVRAHSQHVEPDTDIEPHSHAWAQVAIAASGVARITAGNATYLVPAWRAIWIPPGVVHVVSVVEAAELLTLYVLPQDGVASPVAASTADWEHCRVLEVTPLLRELVLRMDMTDDRGEPHPPEWLARERRLNELVLDELGHAKPVRLGIALPADKRLRALCRAVLDNPQRHATLAGWAREAGASERTVARLFRDELGTSFGPWRQQVLLGRALTLATQGKPMGLIASELGYASASAFSAMVRRSVGVPPSRFFDRG